MRSLVFVSLLAAGSPALADDDPRGAAALQQVFAAQRAPLRACYEDALKTAPDLSGKFTYTVAIGTDGKVTSVTPKAAAKATERLDRCAVKVLGAMKFKAGKAVTVAYPVIFEPDTPAAATNTTSAAKPASEGTVDPKLVQMFDDAAAKARAGKNKEALAGYRAVLDLQKKKKLAIIPRFPATVHLHIAYTLIDLGKLAEAEKELAQLDKDALGKATQYDYYWTLGNVLGGEGKLKPMFSALVEAISISEDLEDMDNRPAQCWTKILAFTMKAENWAYLEEVGKKALQVAQVRQWAEIETKAKVALAEAKKHRAK